jgi:hypothetical protein
MRGIKGWSPYPANELLQDNSEENDDRGIGGQMVEIDFATKQLTVLFADRGDVVVILEDEHEDG